MRYDWQSPPRQSLGHMWGQDVRRIGEERRRKHLTREQARVDAKRQAQSSASSHKRAMSEEWDRPPGKALRRVDEENVTMRQDITATSDVSS